jgi:hypothetical protein
MNADKMFEELGYKKQEHGTTRIIFVKPADDDGYCLNSISFERKQKLCVIDARVSIQELQAINQKCKELGWIV